ncbi:MAG: alpha/beta hydrolase [Burkholderiales bacterium]|nr:alpha/beta hydrolase [Burkholderiales bacterium]
MPTPLRALAAALALATVLPAAADVTARRFTTSDGVSLNVLEAAPRGADGSTPVVALVPGWSMPASIWRGQLATLGTRFRVLALDPRGQGDSDVPSGGYTLARRAEDLADFLRAERRVVLVGWSLGALESLEFVRRHGEGKLAGLVLVDSSVGEPPAPRGSDFLDRLKKDRAAALDGFVRAIFRTPRTEAEIAALVAGALRLPPEAAVALLSYPVPREHWRAIARGVRAPLLYVVTPQFARQAASLKRHRPGTEVAVFEDAGHALFVDEPERFDAQLADFVTRAWGAK